MALPETAKRFSLKSGQQTGEVPFARSPTVHRVRCVVFGVCHIGLDLLNIFPLSIQDFEMKKNPMSKII